MNKNYLTVCILTLLFLGALSEINEARALLTAGQISYQYKNCSANLTSEVEYRGRIGPPPYIDTATTAQREAACAKYSSPEVVRVCISADAPCTAGCLQAVTDNSLTAQKDTICSLR